nr:MAG TPA: hypothetical protein [Caudoviricetes sp.]
MQWYICSMYYTCYLYIYRANRGQTSHNAYCANHNAPHPALRGFPYDGTLRIKVTPLLI